MADGRERTRAGWDIRPDEVVVGTASAFKPVKRIEDFIRLVAELADYGHADSPPKLLGDRDLNVLVSPLPKNKRAKNPRVTPNGEPGPSKSE